MVNGTLSDHIVLIRRNRRVDMLRLRMLILEAYTQSKFVDPCCHAQKPPKTAEPTLWKTILIFVFLFFFFNI